LYRGVIVWNRTERIIRRGGHHKRARAAADWLRLEAPALRIVSESLWDAAHARLAGTRVAYLGARNGRAGGQPVNGTEGRYLLTGLGQCGVCGGGMVVHTRGRWERGASSYGCMAYYTGGRVVCPNGLEVLLVAADEGVLAAVERDLLRVEVLETALAKALDLARPDVESLTGHAHRLREELARLDAEVSRLAGAIAAGGELSALLSAL
jgi:site-specific DNA recombinase